MYEPNALDHALTEMLLSVSMAITSGDVNTAKLLFKSADELRAEWEARNNTLEVVLVSFGEKKISVIKQVRTFIKGMGLKQAKDLVEQAPVVLKTMDNETAKAFCQALNDAGGTAKVQPGGKG